MKLFLTYGNDKFNLSKKRICKEANDLNIFDKIICETDKTIINDTEFSNQLLNNDFKNVFNSRRGGGYYIWKPYIIYKHLQLLNHNDILVFVDAGCKIDNNIEEINKLINMTNNNKGLLVFGTGQIENKWTKGDIFKYFNCLNNEKIYNTEQIASGILFIKKNDFTIHLITEWWNTCKKQPNLINDSISNTPNFNVFRENRHDQSLLSIICKLNNAIDINNLIYIESLAIKCLRLRI